jgi:VIT1/CCC1 family predicted Fe2+/Mn2+ transporter
MRKYTRSAIYERASLLRDTILSANDGIITTFAVVAGAKGANLDHSIVILLGLANLAADAISMSAGNFLGVESENEVIREKTKSKLFLSPGKSAAITFSAFAIAGTVPLLPYLFSADDSYTFGTSIALVFLTLIAMGFLRGAATSVHKVRTILETIFVGGVAAAAAYSIGYWGDQFLS